MKGVCDYFFFIAQLNNCAAMRPDLNMTLQKGIRRFSKFVVPKKEKQTLNLENCFQCVEIVRSTRN